MVRLQAGFTLIELLIIVAVLSIILGMAVPAYFKALDQAKTTRAIGDIKAIQHDIKYFEFSKGRIPDTLDDVGRGDLNDAWGNPYQYLSFAGLKGTGKMRKNKSLVPLNATYDLYSMGEDGESSLALTAKDSQDDIVRANDGGFVGLVSDY